MSAKPNAIEEMRWRDYVLLRGAAFEDFWSSHVKDNKRKLLFIAGRGFDPRTALGLEKLVIVTNSFPIDLLALEFEESEPNTDALYQNAVVNNWNRLKAAVSNRGAISTQSIQFRSPDGHRVAARNAADIISSKDVVEAYTDIVVDISAMPRAVFFPLISRLLYFHDSMTDAGTIAPNIHVLVCEDPALDTCIIEQGVDETASFLHPFEGEFNREARGVHPAVWIPVLGEGRTTQFERIYELVRPEEICPVLPSPSRNPRRGDDIVVEYRDLLFDQLHIDPRNIIYASENNPFEVYRQIRQAALHYDRVLGLIGGCRVSLSALCGKLMSLGVMLVAYEMKAGDILKVGVGHIECQNYALPAQPSLNVEHVGLWLAGECYG